MNITPEYIEALNKFERMVKGKPYRAISGFDWQKWEHYHTLEITEPTGHLSLLQGFGKTSILAFIDCIKFYVETK